jgi:hypothetical protein
MRFSDLISKNESHVSQAMGEGGLKDELAKILETQRPSSVYVMSNSIAAYRYVSSMLPAINVVKDNDPIIFKSMATCGQSRHFVGTRKSTVTGIIQIHRKFLNSTYFHNEWLKVDSK